MDTNQKQSAHCLTPSPQGDGRGDGTSAYELQAGVRYDR
ncbi:MAG: hypothetical protein ACI8RU_002863 [Zhongshania aliphaticivorans]|jgi:hypothetical protein